MSEKSSCTQCRIWLDEDFSRELHPDARPALEAHLRECGECRSIWEDYQTLLRGMQALAESEGPSLQAQNFVRRAAEAKLAGRSARASGLWAWLLNPAMIAFASL